MKVTYSRKSSDPTYYIQKGVRIGTKTTTVQVRKVGKHSELLKITDDPLAYAINMKNELEKSEKENKETYTKTIDFNEKLTTLNPYSSNIKNIGYFYLQDIYQKMDIKNFINSIQDKTKITFDCDLVHKTLIFDRILHPHSSLSTIKHLNSYFGDISFDYQHILRFFDLLESNYDDYLEALFNGSEKIKNRNTGICYYDCTNYFFESEELDQEIDPDTGEITMGLRQYGKCKENRPNPIVEMGLFMDGDGIPLSMCIHPGNTNEQVTAVPLERKIKKMFNGKPFCYVADGGLGSMSIRQFNSMGGNAFIVTQSLRKTSKDFQNTVFEDTGYKLLSDGSPISITKIQNTDFSNMENDKELKALYNDVAYKVFPASKAVDLGLCEYKTTSSGKLRKVKSKGILNQEIIVTFSIKELQWIRWKRNRQIDAAKNMIKKKVVEDIKKGPNDVTRFIKRTSVGKDGDPAIDHYELNQSEIDEEEKFDGYYALATNLIGEDVNKLIRIASFRNKIEDCFRIMKTDFRARPVYHRNKARIIAHFLICYTSLLIYRLLECKLDEIGQHFTTEEIIESLRDMNVVLADPMHYISAYNLSPIYNAYEDLFHLELDRKYYRPKDLNKKLKKIS